MPLLNGALHCLFLPTGITKNSSNITDTVNMKNRRKSGSAVNLKPYDMWTEEDYENAIPEETRRNMEAGVKRFLASQNKR